MVALRNPVYIDYETLLAHAEYHEVEGVPRDVEVTERTTKKRSGEGRIGAGSIGASGTIGKDVEYQSTYRLAPTEKAVVSRAIDALVGAGAVKVNPDGGTSLSRDDLVEMEGRTRITAASLAGKLFYMLKRLLGAQDLTLESLAGLQMDDLPVATEFKRIYLQNELLPVPLLLELAGSDLPQKVYINIRPNHFVDDAASDRIEGDLRVLGTVSHLVPGGNEGFLSAEEWLLPGWEHLVRRTLMTTVEDAVRDLTAKLSLDLPAEDVGVYIKGPAIVVDAIGIY